MELSHWGRKSIGCPWLVLQIYDRPMMGNLGYLLAVKSWGFKPASLIAHRFGKEVQGNHKPPVLGVFARRQHGCQPSLFIAICKPKCSHPLKFALFQILQASKVYKGGSMHKKL